MKKVVVVVVKVMMRAAGHKKEKKAGSRRKREPSKQKAVMDPDHRLLLKNARPLLQSRNSADLDGCYLYDALVWMEPYMKSFFVRTSSDPTQIKLLKLEILTNIANEKNIPPILREFQTYISSQDKEFVAVTIQAIGRCASNIKQVAETCLNGLVSLLSHRDPAVVGGVVVVAKTLLQTQRSGSKPVIAQLSKMVDRVTVAPARAAILWLLGEHCERLSHLPPDLLRKMAKTFPDEAYN